MGPALSWPHWFLHMLSGSTVSDSLQPHRLQSTRLLCAWDSPGNNTGVGCHFLLPQLCLERSKHTINVIYHHMTFPTPLDKYISNCVLQSLGLRRVGHSEVTEQQRQHCSCFVRGVFSDLSKYFQCSVFWNINVPSYHLWIYSSHPC